MMKYISLFSGIGGFEYGIQQSYNEYAHICKESEEEERIQRGERASDKQGLLLHARNRSAPLCVGFSEIDKYAKAIYQKHYPNHPDLGDATQINPNDLPDFDLLVAGFPCQAFSVAGKGRGFCDPRGTLFFEILRILKEKKPPTLLLENVRGLLSNDKGRTFQTIIGLLTSIGYDLEWQVLNSKDFGVPQNRGRVFIIGHLRGYGGGKVFPLEGANRETLNYIGALMSEKNQEWINDGKQLSRNFPQGQRVYDSKGISSTLCGNAGGLGGKTGLYAVPTTKEGNSHAIDANYYKGAGELNKGRRTQIVVPVLTPDRENKRQNGRRFKEEGEPSFTITSQDRHGICDGIRIRRLTPTECERLQGFPDGWTKEGTINGQTVQISDTQRYKCLGNAVTTTVITKIIEKLWSVKYDEKCA
jgi:DNA (cytosine-5)-methyltransferase 1